VHISLFTTVFLTSVKVYVLHRNISECVMYALAYLLEAGSIPDEVSVFFIDITVPAALWPWCRHSL